MVKSNNRNPRNAESFLFRSLTRLLSGPVSDYRRQNPRSLKRQQLDKFKFKSASGQPFKKSSTNPLTQIYANTRNNQNRAERYIDFDQMEYDPLINAAMDVYAAEMTTSSPLQKLLTIVCPNEEIKGVLEHLYYSIMNIEYNIFGWCRDVCKYGDKFIYLDIDEKEGVRYFVGIPPMEVERLEGEDKTNPSYVQFQWNSGGLTFENWQIAHFRILGHDKYAPFGTSVLDGARRIWRQLKLQEDAMMAYRVVRCLTGDTKIWTSNDGYKNIKDIKTGDKVYSYEDNKLVLSEVLDWVNNGKQQVWEVKSKHRSIRTNFNHPILVKNKKTDIIDYVSVDKLLVGEHQFVLPRNIETTETKNIGLDLSLNKYKNMFACLNNEGIKYFRNQKYRKSIRSIEKEIEKDLSYTSKRRISQFLYRNEQHVKGLPINIANEVIKRLNIPEKYLFVYPEGLFNIDEINLPKVVDEEFARFFGFMVGDGFMTKTKHKVGFATGVDKDINEYYYNILKKYCSKAVFRKDKRNKNPLIGRYEINSVYFCNIMEDLGFTSSVYTKKVPNWIFNSSNDIKKSFIQGLAEADSHIRDGNIFELELCNKQILEGVKELAHQIGWSVSSSIKTRIRNTKNREINGNIFKKKETTSYYISVSKRKTDLYENIISIEQTEDYEDVYDIRVDNKNHNFVANGIVVHNSPERRVFYIDVGGIPEKDVQQHMERIISEMKRNQVMDPSTGQIDLRYNAMPVHKDSPIPLLDGRTITIEQLAKEHDEGKENWVYSVIEKNHQVAPGKVKWCGKNYTAKKLTKVWLNDGTYILSAPEHPFMLRDGRKIRAAELKENDALMPFYRDVNNKGYERVYNPNTQNYETTHTLVAKDVYKEQWNTTEQPVIHHKHPQHKEKNKRNNSPDNLEVMNFWQHRKFHQDHCALTLNTPEQLLERSKLWKEMNVTQEHKDVVIKTNKLHKKAQKMGAVYNGSELHKEHNKIRKEAQLKSWKENKETHSKAMRWNIPDECIAQAMLIYKENPTFNKFQFIEAFRSNNNILTLLKNNNTLKRNVEKVSEPVIVKKIKEMGYSGISDFKKVSLESGYRNHKVKLIETIECEGEDVYCMTVVGPNGEDDRHNFVILSLDKTKNICYNSGAVVLNSVDEDYFIATIGPNSGTRIESLPGGSYPVRKDSFIPLLDGRVLTIEQLAKEFDEGKVNWVYSVLDDIHQVVPGKVKWCGKNYVCDKLHRIWLDDDSYADMAPEHPVILRNGERKRADELKENDSLMPFYFEISKNIKEKLKNYPQVYNPKNNKHEFVHRLVANSIGGKNDALLKSNEKSAAIHHVDFDKNNNTPNNLKWMGFWEHRDFHHQVDKTKASETLRKYLLSPLHKENIKKRVHDPDDKLHKWIYGDENIGRLRKWNKSGEARKQISIRNKKRWLDVEFKDNHSGNNHWLKKKWNKHYSGYSIQELVTFCISNNVKTMKDYLGCSDIYLKGRTQCLQFLKHHNVGSWKAFRKTYLENIKNHKVVKVEILTDIDDVYCMEVVGPNDEDDRHNFALCTKGISVGEGKLNGFFVQNTGDIDDVKYLRDNMLAALKIPHAYLVATGDAVEDKTTLSQKDIQFARTIQRLQRSIISELEKIGLIHLYILGYRGKDLLSFKLRLNNPSKIAEITELEHWKLKFEVAAAATEGYFSKRWVAKNILELSDEVFLRNIREQFFDAKLAAQLESVAAGGAGEEGDELGGLGGEEGEEGLGGEEAEEEGDETLLAAPGKRHDEYITPGAKGKKYKPVAADGRTSGARRRNILGMASRELASPTSRNTMKGLSGLMSLGAGIYEDIETNYQDKELLEEANIMKTNQDIKLMIRELEKSSKIASNLIVEQKDAL